MKRDPAAIALDGTVNGICLRVLISHVRRAVQGPKRSGREGNKKDRPKAVLT
jgi:hypothetical protein